MIVLGINETHCATAAMLRDGEVIACASEERFTRVKNDAGYPRRAVEALLSFLGLTPRQIDVVALAGARMAGKQWLDRVLQDDAYIREYYGVRLPSAGRRFGRRVRKLGARFGLIDASRGKFAMAQAERLARVEDHLGIGRQGIVCLDHHSCHAAAAYFGSPYRGHPALVLTNDNSGDGLCATASSAAGHRLTRHEASRSAPGSLGAFYSFVTLYLGMKFGEHEYKVMGLAPYAGESGRRQAYRALKEVFDQYASGSGDYGFSRSHIPVFLARYGDENLVSRSQAKRLLNRLERFKEIVFDFQGVGLIGQAFADEIFRVFQNEHPEANLTWINASADVNQMIRRASGRSGKLGFEI